MISMLVFLLSLPLAVYTYAGLLQLIDQNNRFTALLQLAFRIVCVALLVQFTPGASRLWIGAAFGLVLFLHAASQILLRYCINSGRWPTRRSD